MYAKIQRRWTWPLLSVLLLISCSRPTYKLTLIHLFPFHNCLWSVEGRQSSQRDVQTLTRLQFDSRDSTLLLRAAPEVFAEACASRASTCGVYRNQEPVEKMHVRFLTEPYLLQLGRRNPLSAPSTVNGFFLDHSHSNYELNEKPQMKVSDWLSTMAFGFILISAAASAVRRL